MSADMPWCRRCRGWHSINAMHIGETNAQYEKRMADRMRPRTHAGALRLLAIAVICAGVLLKCSVDKLQSGTAWPDCSQHPALHIEGRAFDCDRLPDGSIDVHVPRPRMQPQ